MFVVIHFRLTIWIHSSSFAWNGIVIRPIWRWLFPIYSNQIYWLMWRFIVVVSVINLKLQLFKSDTKLTCVVYCRYGIQGTQTHIGSMFKEFCWFIWISTAKSIMCCYFRSNVGWKYVGASRIYVQGWGACFTRGTKQLFKGRRKPSGKIDHWFFYWKKAFL